MHFLFELGYYGLPYSSYKNLKTILIKTLKQEFSDIDFNSDCIVSSKRRLGVNTYVTTKEQAQNLSKTLLRSLYNNYPTIRPIWLCALVNHELIKLRYKNLTSRPYTYTSLNAASLRVTASNYRDLLAATGVYVLHSDKMHSLNSSLDTKKIKSKYDLDYYLYYFEGLQVVKSNVNIPEKLSINLLNGIYNEVLGVKPSLIFNYYEDPSRLLILLPKYKDLNIGHITSMWTNFCQNTIDNVNDLLNKQGDCPIESLEGDFLTDYKSLKTHVSDVKSSLRTLGYDQALDLCHYFYAGHKSFVCRRFNELKGYYSAHLLIQNKPHARHFICKGAIDEGDSPEISLVRSLISLDYIKGILLTKDVNILNLKKDPYQIRRHIKEFMICVERLDMSLDSIFNASDVNLHLKEFLISKLKLRFSDIYDIVPNVYLNNFFQMKQYQLSYNKHLSVYKNLEAAKKRLEYFSDKLSLCSKPVIKDKKDPLLVFIKKNDHNTTNDNKFEASFNTFAVLPSMIEHYIDARHIDSLSNSEKNHTLFVFNILLTHIRRLLK